MNRWILLGLLAPSVATATTFTATDISSGPVSNVLDYDWDIGSGVSGTVTITFMTATPLPTSSLRVMCQDANVSGYCFKGWFRSSDKGFGTFVSESKVDIESCTNGTDVNHGAFFRSRTQTACAVEQVVTITYADTGASWEFVAGVSEASFSEMRVRYSDGTFANRGNKKVPALTVSAATAGSPFEGTMRGSFFGDIVTGTFTEN